MQIFNSRPIATFWFFGKFEFEVILFQSREKWNRTKKLRKKKRDILTFSRSWWFLWTLSIFTGFSNKRRFRLREWNFYGKLWTYSLWRAPARERGVFYRWCEEQEGTSWANTCREFSSGKTSAGELNWEVYGTLELSKVTCTQSLTKVCFSCECRQFLSPSLLFFVVRKATNTVTCTTSKTDSTKTSETFLHCFETLLSADIRTQRKNPKRK